MSGSSRIGGSGSYGGYGGLSRQGGRSASLERFRQGRKVGDVVSGVFLRFENDTFGRALLEGEELLAHLPAEGPRPKEGEAVFFCVDALAPEVVLRMVSSVDPLARLSLVLPPVPLSQEVALYTAARDTVDTLLAVSGALRGKTGTAARDAFIDAVANSPAMAEAFAESRARSRTLVRAASRAGLACFRHMPWLCPGVTALEVSVWDKGESPVLAGGTLASGDRVLVSGSFENGTLRHRLTVIPVSGGANTVPDIVARILVQTALSGGAAVGRFSRTL